jgi:hypothetical protein
MGFSATWAATTNTGFRLCDNRNPASNKLDVANCGLYTPSQLKAQNKNYFTVALFKTLKSS